MPKDHMLRDGHKKYIQAFVADPDKSVVPQTLTTTLNLSTLVTLADTIAVKIRSSAEITRYFNSQTTKYVTVPADTDVIVMIADNVGELTLSGTATVELEFM